jgi:hypothetical protein
MVELLIELPVLLIFIDFLCGHEPLTELDFFSLGRVLINAPTMFAFWGKADIPLRPRRGS